MDLNKAMVEMYKQRSAANKHKALSGKRQKFDSENNNKTKVKTIESEENSRVDETIEALDYKPKGQFQNLYGCGSARDQLLKIVNRFQRSIDGSALKSQWPVLICGSRGLGKTSIVEAAANHAHLKLIPIKMKSLVEQTRNEFKISVQKITAFCKSIGPAIVLIDDLDQISEKEELKMIMRGAVRNFLQEDKKLLVFCTSTSIVDSDCGIDFLFTIQLRRPDIDARYLILKNSCENNPNLVNISDTYLRDLALKTPSFTALDLKKMLDIAETESDGSPSMIQCDQAVDFVKRSFRRGTHLIGEKPGVSWTDIGGMSEVQRAFIDILKQIRKGEVKCKFAGIALYGPPGCGKTMVAQAMANEAGLNFISIKPAELVDKFLGETEKNIRRVFSEAQEFEPCMIYFDEFDGLCGTRGSRDNVTSAIQTLLSEMDGFAGRGKSIILASTNRLEDIDPAMKRPGRLSKHIYVGPPDLKARQDILKVISSRPSLSFAPEIDLHEWACKTENFTGADLDFLVSEAESRAIAQSDDNSTNEKPTSIQSEQLEYALKKILSTNKEIDKKTRMANNKQKF